MTRLLLWVIVITVAVMFLSEQGLVKMEGVPTDFSEWFAPSPEEVLVKEKARLETEIALKEQIRLQTPSTRVIKLEPGQTVRVPVGEKYEFDCRDGEFYFSLLYKGQQRKTGYFKPGFMMNTGSIPVDEIEFHQNPQYPYGDLAILLTSTPAE